MNKQAMAAWPKDFETGLAAVPHGDFTDFGAYPNSTLPAQVRKLPVLRGHFNGPRLDLDPQLETHIGWGTVPVGSQSLALTFRIQRGPNLLYWLANPADQRVWEVLDQWAAAQTMALAAEFQDGTVVRVSRSFELHPDLSKMRACVAQANRMTPVFMKDAAMAILTDEVKHTASSDIAAYPQLQHVQACMVATQHTGGVVVMLNDEAPGPNGPVADALTALAKAMGHPEKPRH